jgi:ATP-dependent DNA helicase RecG
MSEVLSEVEIEKMAPIIRHLQEHGSITPKEAMAATGKSAATARRYLAFLCDKGVLSATGNTNAISYSLNNVNRLRKIYGDNFP